MKLRLVALCIAAISTDAHAQIITTCSDPKGHAAMFGSAAEELGEYIEDGLSGATVSLMRTAGGYDLQFEQPSLSFSVSGDGGTVTILHDSPESLVLQARYPRNLETYQFNLDAHGNGRLAWSQHRFANRGTDKVALFNAKCSAVN